LLPRLGFVTIPPFEDGNDRIDRAIADLVAGGIQRASRSGSITPLHSNCGKPNSGVG
jgi:hypothetical protein